jgi:hypothetical protein
MDLLGEETPQKRVKAPPDNSTVRAEDAFKAAFSRRWTDTPLIYGNIGRNRAILKRLVEQLGEETVVQTLIPEFFTSTDPQVVRLQYTVPDLERVAQRLLINRNSRERKLHPRTQANVDEAQKATGKKT